MPPTDDPRLVALARMVERTARRVGDLETLLQQLAADVVQAAGQQAHPGTDDGADVVSWLLVDDLDQALAAVVDLAEWVGRVYLRYPGAGLPSCWLWHPALVEELTWLRACHAEAYSGTDGAWRLVGDWHDRQRPGVVKRLTEAYSRCDLTKHEDRPEQEAPLARSAPRIAHAQVEQHRPPRPTEAELQDAHQIRKEAAREDGAPR